MAYGIATEQRTVLLVPGDRRRRIFQERGVDHEVVRCEKSIAILAVAPQGERQGDQDQVTAG
ncbi:MAG: hypothetical protein IPG69_03045 [Flavobacteriales bacterium]|nr:hypothetical protein [Flavobacteriales bacterium]